jgi:hypothetical protein
VTPHAILLPWTRHQLSAELENKAEDIVDYFHDRCCFLAEKRSENSFV